MNKPFETATRTALEEIVLTHTTESKFGYLLTEDRLKSLCDDLHSFFKTSRNLKDAGDRFWQNALKGEDKPLRK